MEHKLQLCVFMLLIHVSHALWQRMTVIKGQTVDLSCPITNSHDSSVEWKNPDGLVLYFKRDKGEGLRDPRVSLKTLSETEFTISISGVTLKDGGNYTCTHYGNRVTDKIVELTVLSDPQMTRVNHKGRFDIKCTAEANQSPPQIFWKFDQGPEIIAHPQLLHEGKKFVSKAMLRLQSVENRVTVKCLVRHPALHSQPLMDFVKVGKDSSKYRRVTTTRAPTAQTRGSAEVTTTGWFKHGSTTVFHLTTTDGDGPSSGSAITVTSSQLFSTSEPKTATEPTGFPLSPNTSTDSHLNTTDNSRTSVTSGSTETRNGTISNATSTTGRTSVSETTEITSYNHTEGNATGDFNDPNRRTGSEGSSSLLVVLVTFLILCLLVVVIFFAIKLRRAHIIWKRENEDSDPSEESSKSKSSQEERNAQGQRRRGFFNTAFTQYVVEQTPVMTSATNTAAMAATETVNKEQTPQPQTLGQTPAKSAIKETEL